jgi:hypothetical protein
MKKLISAFIFISFIIWISHLEIHRSSARHDERSGGQNFSALHQQLAREIQIHPWRQPVVEPSIKSTDSSIHSVPVLTLTLSREQQVLKALSKIPELNLEKIKKETIENPHVTSREQINFVRTMTSLLALVEDQSLTVDDVRPIIQFFSDCSLNRGRFRGSTSAIQVVCLSNLKEVSLKHKTFEKELREALAQSSPRNIQIYEFLRAHQSRGT